MSLFYLDKGGLTAFWSKVKGLFSKTKPVFINFHSTGNHFWYNNYDRMSGDNWWVFDSITSVDGEVLTNEQLYQLYSNGAPIYLVMNSIVSNTNYYITIPLFSQQNWISTPSSFLIFRSQEQSAPGNSSSDKTITVDISTSSPYTDPEIWYIVQTTHDAEDILYTDYSGNISSTNVKDAINEVYSDIPEEAYDISYDNTSSGLSSSDVQNAIDEVITNMPSDADDISYDNTSSGLTATNVQNAIDELSQSSPGGVTNIDDLSDVSASNPSRGEVLIFKGTSTPIGNTWYSGDAGWIGYNNSTSGLTADYVGDAIDELASMISGGSDPQYARGDSVNLEDGVFAGSWYQPKTLFFFIPLPKGMANTGSVSISGKWLVRAGTGGRIIDNVALNTVGTVSVNKKATGIMVRVVLSTASTTYTTDQACTAYGSSSAKITFNT